MSENGFSGFGVGPNPSNQQPVKNWYDDLPPEERARYQNQPRPVQPSPAPVRATQPPPAPQQQPVRPVQPPSHYQPPNVVRAQPATPQYVAPQPVIRQPPPSYIPPSPAPTYQPAPSPVYSAPPPPPAPVTNQPTYYAQPSQPSYTPPAYAGSQTQFPPAPPRIRKKTGRAFVGLAITLSVLAGIFGAGVPAYNYVSGILENPEYVSSAGTGDSAPSVSSTDLSTAIWAAEQVVSLATDKVDSTELQASIESANTLLGKSDPSAEELGRAQSELIVESEDVKRAIKVVDVESVSADVKKKLASGYFHSGATRKDDVRNMLDALGGKDIGIIYQDIPCDMDKAAGCVSSEDPTVMYISPIILDPAYYQDHMLLQTIAHEYGHTVHFRTGYHRVFNDPEVSAAFDDDPEHLADCMAEDIEGVVFTTYGYKCNDAQLSAARKVWTGNLTS